MAKNIFNEQLDLAVRIVFLLLIGTIYFGGLSEEEISISYISTNISMECLSLIVAALIAALLLLRSFLNPHQTVATLINKIFFRAEENSKNGGGSDFVAEVISWWEVFPDVLHAVSISSLLLLLLLTVGCAIPKALIEISGSPSKISYRSLTAAIVCGIIVFYVINFVHPSPTHDSSPEVSDAALTEVDDNAPKASSKKKKRKRSPKKSSPPRLVKHPFHSEVLVIPFLLMVLFCIIGHPLPGTIAVLCLIALAAIVVWNICFEIPRSMWIYFILLLIWIVRVAFPITTSVNLFNVLMIFILIYLCGLEKLKSLAVVLLFLMTICLYYRGLVYIVERASPSAAFLCSTAILNNSNCSCPPVSTSFFESIALANSSVYRNDSALIGAYHSNNYFIIGKTNSSGVKEMNFTGVVAYNFDSHDIVIAVHDIQLKADLHSSFYNFNKYYQNVCRRQHRELVHYILALREKEVSSISVVSKGEYSIMAQIIAGDIQKEIDHFSYRFPICVRVLSFGGFHQCVPMDDIFAKISYCDFRPSNSSLPHSAIDISVSGEVDIDLLKSVPNRALMVPSTNLRSQGGNYNVIYLSYFNSSKWMARANETAEVTKHITYGEVVMFVGDIVESSGGIDYRENLMGSDCRFILEAIVESFFPDYEYLQELRGFAGDDGNPVFGIALLDTRSSELLFVFRSGIITNSSSFGLFEETESWRNEIAVDLDSKEVVVAKLLADLYKKPSNEFKYPQRSLQATCRAILKQQIDHLNKSDSNRKISVRITGHDSGAALAVLVALDLAEVARVQYPDINIGIVSFAIPATIGNKYLGDRLKDLRVSHVEYFNLEDKAVNRIVDGFDSQLNQEKRGFLIDFKSIQMNVNDDKRSVAAHRLDIILHNMALAAMTSRPLSLLNKEFNPAEANIAKGECKRFAGYIADVFCEDYNNIRGKQCNSKAEQALKGEGDFKFFIEEHVAQGLKAAVCGEGFEFCDEMIDSSLEAIDDFEYFFDISTMTFEALKKWQFFDDDINEVFRALGFYSDFKLPIEAWSGSSEQY